MLIPGKVQVDPKTLVLAVAAILPVLVANSYVLHVLILCGIYVILATSLDLISGVADQLDLGHAAFYGIGAYTSSLLVVNLFRNAWYGVWVGILAGSVLAGLFGYFLGIPTLRIKGDYLAIVTLGFGEIVRFVLLNWSSLTRGPMGITGIPAPRIGGFEFASRQSFYLLTLAVTVLCVFSISRLKYSRVGRALVAIREDAIAASSVGINIGYYKVWAFAVSATYAGLAGALFAHYMSFISPANFSGNESILILTMVVLGGKSSIPGSILGAITLVVLPELLRALESYRMLIYGFLLTAMMIFKPRGLWPEDRTRYAKWLLKMAEREPER